MRKYRIAKIKTVTPFGDDVYRYAVQVRIALFWWVTIETCGTATQARYYLNKSGAIDRPVEIIKIIKRYPDEKANA